MLQKTVWIVNLLDTWLFFICHVFLQYSAERQDHAHQGLLERMEFIRYKVKTEMSLLRTQYQVGWDLV